MASEVRRLTKALAFAAEAQQGRAELPASLFGLPPQMSPRSPSTNNVGVRPTGVTRPFVVRGGPRPTVTPVLTGAGVSL